VLGTKSPQARRDPPREQSGATFLLAGTAAAIAITLCIPALQGLGYLWRRNEFYGHAYAVPLVAAFLAWGNRVAISRALRSLDPPPLGAFVAFGAALFLGLAVIGDAGFLAGLGIPLLLAATLYAIGGAPLLRPLLLPLTFLALMVPPPAFLEAAILVRLKLFVTEVAVGALHAAGATVLAEGNLILVPEGELFVADACSGLTSIVTMLPISCIVAYFLARGIWRRVLIVLSVVPLAIAGNIGRVIGTVLLTSRFGLEAAQGALHESFGLATYVVGTLALVGVARLLRWV
jgi:exosortase